MKFVIFSVLVCLSIFSFVGVIGFGSLWFGVFFGLNYPEIKLKQQFTQTNCTIVKQEIVQYKCCHKECACDVCDPWMGVCNEVEKSIQSNETKSCCESKGCCGKTTCYTKHNCQKLCYYNMKNQHCMLSCYSCNRVDICLIVLEPKSGEWKNTTISRNCGRSQNCIVEFLETHKVGQTKSCGIKTNNSTTVKFDLNYTPTKIKSLVALTTLFAVWILFLCCSCVALIFILPEIR